MAEMFNNQEQKSNMLIYQASGATSKTDLKIERPVSGIWISNNDAQFNAETITVKYQDIKNGKTEYLYRKESILKMAEFIQDKEEYFENNVTNGLVFIPFTFDRLGAPLNENRRLYVELESLNAAHEIQVWGVECSIITNRLIQVSRTQVETDCELKTINVEKCIRIGFQAGSSLTEAEFQLADGGMNKFTSDEMVMYCKLNNGINYFAAGVATHNPLGVFPFDCTLVKNIEVSTSGVSACDIWLAKELSL